MRLAPFAITLIATFALAGTARASVAIALSVEELTQKSDLVVRGHVTSQESAWTRSGRIVTTVHLAVDSSLKGQAPATVDIRHTGGHVGDVGQQVSGEVAFANGEEVVVFLRRRPGSTTAFGVVGMSQGKFRVDRATSTPVATQKLEGLGLMRPSDHAIEDRPGASLPLGELEQRIARAAAP